MFSFFVRNADLTKPPIDPTASRSLRSQSWGWVKGDDVYRQIGETSKQKLHKINMNWTGMDMSVAAVIEIDP